MANLNMGSAYPLTEETVKAQVKDKIGNYAFRKFENNIWRVKYVGRSDSQLQKEIIQQARLHKMLDVEGYEFKFSYANNITEAYEKECQNYHDFGENKCLLNERHPKKPADNNHYHCPVESCPEHEDK